MPSNLTFKGSSFPSKIVKVSADEMIAIMRRNSSKSFVPVVMHNNEAGAPIFSHVL